MCPNNKYFFITTNGNSASRWLAQTLNMHPDIICSHSPARISISMSYDHAYSDNEFRKIMGDEYRKRIPVDMMLDELEQTGEALCYGNVHMFNLRQLRENTSQNKTKKCFRVVDLVRHPVPFVQSGTSNMLRQAQFNSDRLKYLESVYFRNRELYDDFASIYELDFNDLNVLSFMANVMTLKSLSINMQIQDVDHRITMESITKDKMVYRNLVDIISEGEVSADDQWLSDVFSTNAINRHKVGKRFSEPKEIYNGWANWQKDFFDLLVEISRIDRHYSTAFEYDFSFLQKYNR